MKGVSHHLQHYLPLIGIFCVSIVGFIAFSYDKTFQEALVLAVAVSYVTWGIIHHHLHGDLHLSVIVEYIAVAVLGAVLLLSLIFRA